MTESRTERGTCQFLVQKAADGKPVIVAQLYHPTVTLLNDAVLGFDLLGGTTPEQARKVAEMLNENVLDLFVTLSESRPK